MVVNFASGLNSCKEHTVHVATNEFDPKYCFDECKNLNIRSYGWVRLFDRLSQIVSASLNNLLLAVYLIFSGFGSQSSILSYDVIFIDIIAISAVLLKAYFTLLKIYDFLFSFKGSERKYPLIIFYCHFPDKFLAKPKSVLHAMFRIPFDLLEQFYMWFPDQVIFNSKFTRSQYSRAFPVLSKAYPQDNLHVIYPSIVEIEKQVSSSIPGFIKTNYILSLNRFDAKKNLERAIYLCQFMKTLNFANKPYFIIAGGFDPKNSENCLVLAQLQALARQLDLSWAEGLEDSRLSPAIDIVFLKGVSASLKFELLDSAKLLFYTPSNEHFGIIPLEAMSLGGAFVFAMASGGPAEYIQHKKTGYLIPDHQKNTQDSFLNTLSTEELADFKLGLEMAITRADSAAAKNVKETACQFAKSNFKIEASISRLLEIYEGSRKKVFTCKEHFMSLLVVISILASISFFMKASS